MWIHSIESRYFYTFSYCASKYNIVDHTRSCKLWYWNDNLGANNMHILFNFNLPYSWKICGLASEAEN